MPEVGSVYIRVRAITDKVGPDIQKAFSSLNSGSIAKAGEAVGDTFGKAVSKNFSSGIFGQAAKALESFGGEAGSARDKLYELSKAGYFGGTAITGLLGAVSSLIGGLGGLIGVVGGAIPAVMGLVGAFASLRIGMAVGQLAMSGIMQAVGKATTSYAGYGKSVAAVAKMYRDLKYAQEDAALGQKRAVLELEKARANLIRTQDLPANSMARKEALLAYQEAELNLRKAKDKNKEAGMEAKDPNIFSGTDPFAGLSESQKKFAQFLVSLKPKFDELKEAAAKGFLPILEKNIKGLMKDVFPTFKQGIKDIAVGLGGLTTNLSNIIRDPHNVELLGIVMKNIGTNLPIMGTIMGNIYSGMLTVLKASDPLVKRFLKFLETKTKTFSDWLKAKDATGELEDFFTKAGNIMDKLWKIFEQTLGGFGAIIGANFEPGSGGWIMLDWFDKVTKKFDDLDSTVAGKQSLKQYFIDTAKNSTAILGAVGALVTEFLKLGADPNIGKTFDALKDGAPAMGELGKKFIDAGPALGQLVADITKMINAMTDSQAIKNFFNIIDGGVKAFTGLLTDPVVGPILKILGQIHGAIFGVIMLMRGTGFVSKYIDESITMFSKFLDKFPMLNGVRGKAATAFAAVKATVKDAFSYSFNIMKDFVKNAGSKLASFGSTVGSAVAKGASAAWGGMKNMAAAIWNGVRASIAFLAANPWIAVAAALIALIALTVNFFANTEEGKKMWADFVKFLGEAFTNIGKWFSDLWKGISGWASDTWNAITKSLTDFVNGIPGAIASIGKFFSDVWSNITKWAAQTWKDVVTGITTFVSGIPGAISNIGKFFSDVFNNIVKFIGGIWTKIIGTVAGFVTNVVNGIDKLFPGFKTVFNNVVNFFKGIINNMIGMAESFVNFWIRGINGIVKALNTIKIDIPKGVPFIGGTKFGISIPTIPELRLPRLAQGGTVMPSVGGSIVNVAEAGRPERIEPLDANGLSNRDKAMIDFLTKQRPGAGIQIIVNPSAGMNERDLAEMVSRKLAFELRRGAF